MNKDSINLPAIPLRGITIFPNMIIHFDVGREKSISALEESMLKDSKIFLVSQIDPEIEDPKRNEIYSIGTICKIKQILKLPKGVTRVLVEGVERAAIIDLIDDKKFKEVIVEKIDDDGITLSESHWGGRYFNTVTYQNLSSHYGQTFYGYIYTYNGGVTKKMESKLLNATNQNSDQYMTEKAKPIDVKNQFTLATMDVEASNNNEQSAQPMLLTDKLNTNR